MKTVGLPDTWRVKLKSGGAVLVMAGAYEATEQYHLFTLMFDASEEEQANEFIHISSRFPTQPERVDVTVAAFPLQEVASVEAGDWKEIPSG